MRIRTRSIIIALSRGVTQATTIILAIILVRMISKETLGTYRQVSLVYMTLVGVLTLQLDNSLYYFLPKLGPELRRTLLGQTLTATLLLAAVVAVVMFVSAGPIARMMNNPGLAPLLRIFALFPLANRLFELIPAFMISLDRPVRAGVYTLVRSVAQMGGVVLAFAWGYQLPTVIWLLVLVEAAVVIVGCADMVQLSPLGGWRFRRELIIEQLHYSWPLLAMGIVGTLNMQFGKLLISGFFDPEVYAIYSCGAVEIPVIALVTASVSAALMPNLVTLCKDGNRLAALQLWQEATRKCSLLIFPSFAFLVFVSSDFIVLLFGPEYARAAWPFGIYLAALPIRVAVYATLFRAVGKTKPIAVAALIGLVVNVLLSTALVWGGRGSLLSFIGPAIGTVGSFFAIVAYMVWRLSGVVQVPLSGLMRWRELGQTLLLSVACGLLVFLVPLGELPLAVKLSCQAVIFSAVFLGLMLGMRMLHSDELELLTLPLRVARRMLPGGWGR